MIRALEFYSGIGGLNLALQRSGVEAQVVRAFDWDPAASRVYSENWGKDIVHRTDISRVAAADLSSLDASLWLLSPACQPYTVLNPSAKGSADPRAKSLLHLIGSVLPELAELGKHPRWILVENVAGFEASSTCQTLLSSLQNLGYNILELLLTPLQFSIPNSRLRYYLLAKLPPLTFADIPAGGATFPKRCIPGCGVDWIDPRQRTSNNLLEYQCHELSLYLDPPEKSQDPNYWLAYVVPDKTLRKKGVLFDIVLPNSRRSCCFTRGYTHMVEGTSILQMNHALDTTAAFDSFAASTSKPLSEADDTSLQLLHDLRLRYFTPEELLRLFHFSPAVQEVATQEPVFCWPSNISTKTKYRLIGNSVNVKVVQDLIAYLFKGDMI